MRGDIAVIGDTESITGYKAAGVRTVAISSSAETGAAVKKLAEDKCPVIFVTEQALEGVEYLLDSYSEQGSPAIIPIPGRCGTTGVGMQNLSKNVERALGTNILGEAK